MNTDESLRDSDEDAAVDVDEAALEETGADEEAASAEPNRWHRHHPTFSALSGFFTGLLVVIVIPGSFAALLRAFFDYETAEELFPLVLVTFAVPIGLLVVPRTRRFGRYMLLGMLATAAVVLGVAALVVWILILRDG